MNVRIINLLKNKSWPFWITVISFSFSLFIILGCNILPFFRDDTIYFNAARQFCDHLTTYGNTIINFDYSKIGEFNWYGPGYHLVYGFISSVFGFHSGKTSLVFHLVLWYIIILIIRRQFPENANYISITLIASPYLNFIFTFYPVILNSVVTIIGFLILLKTMSNNIKSTSRNVVLFMLTLVFGTFLRITHIFNFALLYSFTKSKKHFFIITIFFLSLVGLTWGYQLWFCAPMYIAADDVVNNLIATSPLTLLFTVLKNFVANAIKNLLLFDHISLQIWLSVLITLSSPLLVPKTRFAEIKHLYFGVLLFNASLLFVLFGLYTARPFYINKQFIVLFPVNIIFLFVFIAHSKKIKNIIIGLNLLFLPSTIRETLRILDASQKTHNQTLSSPINLGISDFIASKTKTKNTQMVNVLMDHKSFGTISESEYCALMCLLPYNNNFGQQLRYVFIIPTPTSPNFFDDPRSNYYVSLQKESNTDKLKLVDKKDRLYMYEVLH